MRRLFLMSFTVAVLLIGTGAASAGADCSGPTITFAPHDVGRGERVTVVGTNWGDSCWDTGPPPEGQGVLGEPIDDVEIVILHADREWVVWSGAAGDDYDFNAEVVIPVDVPPGPAELTARHGADIGVYNIDPALRISDAAPVTTAAPLTTAPDSTSPSTESAAEPDGDGEGDSPLLIVGVAAAVVLAAAGVAVWALRRR